MMNCEASRILISGYLDEELSDQETRLLKAHLQQCETCVNYLQSQETLKNALKHYMLFQESPQVSDDFAKKVTAKLEEKLPQKRASVVEHIRWTYQKFVFGFVDGWVNSLKARPFIWTTAASCMVILLIGFVSFQVVQQATWQEQAKVVFIGTESPSEPSTFSPKSDPLPSPPQPQMALRETLSVEHEESLRGVESVPESLTVAEQEARENDVIEFTELDELIVEEDGSPFIRVASNHTPSVEDYVYSHVVEVYQSHFVDDALFVGYVQDAFTQ